MTSTTEQGHNRNAANFEKLIAHCVSYGTTYNPSKAAIKTAAIQAQATAAKNSITAVNALTPAYKNAVAARIVAFKPLDKLITKLSNALKASDTTPEVNDAAKTIIRKLQGRRATAKKTDEEKKIAADAGEEIVEISTSQLSYDNRLDNFDKLIKMLASIPQYAPNEAELKITALTALYNDLKTKNAAVITAEIPLNNTRIARNTLLYKDNTGVVDTAATIKTYIKSIYSASSPQSKAISKLQFVKYSN
ncbi:MAG TPA: hypothetical protein VJ780_02370 [Flavobacterium sp.]|nr:hypothetical protein [Flavobacterium sp.]